jgi:hypothetical protein
MKINLLTGLLLMATSTANAALINIDFGPSSSTTYEGQGILGGTTDTTWNAVDFGGASNLTLADDTTGSVNVTTTFDNSYSNLGAASNPRTNTLLADRLWIDAPNNASAQTITFTGLTANSTYNLVLYNGFYAQTYSANGQSATTDPFAASSANNDIDDIFPEEGWTTGIEYATLSSVMSDGSGNLVITVTPLDGDNDFSTDLNDIWATVAGVQIQSVPIPAAFYLFATGLAGLAGIARRKKN